MIDNLMDTIILALALLLVVVILYAGQHRNP